MKEIRSRILADSVRVFVGGVELARGKDFTVDMVEGTITTLADCEASLDEVGVLRLGWPKKSGPAQWKQERNRFINRRR